jgi:hypothetical protein
VRQILRAQIERAAAGSLWRAEHIALLKENLHHGKLLAEVVPDAPEDYSQFEITHAHLKAMAVLGRTSRPWRCSLQSSEGASSLPTPVSTAVGLCAAG